MLRISQIKIPVEKGSEALKKKICEELHVGQESIVSWKIVRKSIEARKREQLSFVYSVNVQVKNEKTVLKKYKGNKVTESKEKEYSLPESGACALKDRPVIVGSGPAGLFCAYILAQKGYRPLILERGEKIEDRKQSVEKFWNGGELNLNSNVQFGEGGAGTFSDGKLNSGVTDRDGRIFYVLKSLAEHGAKEEILYDAKPHVGTDVLYHVVRNIRNSIIAAGGEFRFQSKVEDIVLKNNQLEELVLADKERIRTGICVGAIGHSARDTVEMLWKRGILMQPKAFAVGVRIQHPQEWINEAQWGKNYPENLGAAAYKLSAKSKDGRGVYSFCMCPGGYVVNASSEEKRLAVNGMSYSGRNSGFANGALLVTVNPEDYLSYNDGQLPKELSAIAFQRALEEKAFGAAEGKIPVQRFEDFKFGRLSKTSRFSPCTKGKWEFGDVKGIFPNFISEDLTEGIETLGKKLKKFSDEEALLMGVESRTSSPVRIFRDEAGESNVKGFYPCGEGAGYAGGIVSAAVDGMKIAEAIIKKYKSF